VKDEVRVRILGGVITFSSSVVTEATSSRNFSCADLGRAGYDLKAFSAMRSRSESRSEGIGTVCGSLGFHCVRLAGRRMVPASDAVSKCISSGEEERAGIADVEVGGPVRGTRFVRSRRRAAAESEVDVEARATWLKSSARLVPPLAYARRRAEEEDEEERASEGDG
jgi:hypothetical protein